MTDLLIHGLQAAAIGQIALAVLNFFLPNLLGWHDDLQRLSKLPREVFHVHAWFISITVALFDVLTWRFAEEFALGTHALTIWLTTGIGIFWAFASSFSGPTTAGATGVETALEPSLICS